MVSIPDWTKFQRLHEGQPGGAAAAGGLDRYYRQREEETIRRAELHGLLLTPSQRYLMTACHAQNPGPPPATDVGQLRLVRLCGVHLRRVGDITYCTNLRICVLSNNFLTKIDALAACRQLLKLDLHSNQLSTLPGIAFWSGLRRLRFLYLHDNPLGQYENLQNLATCSHLTALTMYDTPICLKRNYRHHVVNSIWSLKALDNYVVSDEEIIEDAVFGGRYATRQPAFRIQLYYSTSQYYTYDEELLLCRHIEAKINHIQAHHSPVLIVQRYVRGYLQRKHYRVGVNRISKVTSAGSTAMPVIPSDVVPPPPSSSPAFGLTASTTELQGPDMAISDGVSMDYDMYMKGRRPDSSAPSESTYRRDHREGYQGPFPTPLNQHYDEPGTPSEATINSAHKKRTNLLINLAKLQAGTFSSLYDEQIAIETILPADAAVEKPDSTSKKKTRRRRERLVPKKIVKSVKQFFGPVVEALPSPEVPAADGGGEEEDSPVTQYRLRGYRPNISLVDPTMEMILSRQEAGRVVRDAEVEHHRRLQELPPPQLPARLNKPAINNDHRIFARVHGTMGMSCLFAVHQAYKDREKAERTASKMENIIAMRGERDRAKERIRMYHEEKRSNALKQRDIERTKTLDNLEKREMLRLNYLDKRQEVQNKSCDLTRSYKADYTFVTEFSNQHTSVSNALMRHDRQARYEDDLQVRTEQVQRQGAVEHEQQDVVRKYLEHRQLMRQTESAMARATLDTRMLQEANDRMIETKTRVAQQKARHDTVQSFYPLPVMTPVPQAASAPPMITHGLTRWETHALISHGRIGKHPTMVL